MIVNKAEAELAEAERELVVIKRPDRRIWAKESVMRAVGEIRTGAYM